MLISKKVYKELIHSLGNVMEEVLKLRLTVQNLQNEIDELKKRPTLNVDLLKEDMKEDEEKNCNDCINASVSPYKEPCVSCAFNPFNTGYGTDKFHSTEEKNCDNCKHIELMGDEYPCNMCFDYALWETQNDE